MRDTLFNLWGTLTFFEKKVSKETLVFGPAQGVRAHGRGFWLAVLGEESSDRRYGGLAQLGERLPCKQEVSGSNPLISIRKIKDFANPDEGKLDRGL